MTDRLKGCTVVFERDIREDDAEHLLGAIRMLRGVLKVAPVLTTPDDYFARERARREISEKVFEALKPEGA